MYRTHTFGAIEIERNVPIMKKNSHYRNHVTDTGSGAQRLQRRHAACHGE